MATTREITAAVTALETSTSAIQSQMKLLVANREYLRTFQAQQAEADVREKDRTRARRLESQNFSLAVDESIETLSGDLQRLEQNLSGQIKLLDPSLAKLLLQDDRVLKKAAELSDVDPDNSRQSKNRVNKLTQVLGQLAQEEIRCRLDRIYLESTGGLSQHDSQKDSSVSVASEESQVRQDLRSLHVEISDVATMAVTQEFHEPLSNLIEADIAKKSTGTQSSLDQISAAVAAIADSAEAYVCKLEKLSSHREAIALLGEEIRVASSVSTAEPVSIDNQEGEEATALRDIRDRWNSASTTAAGIERDLILKKRALTEDRQKTQRDLEGALRVSNSASSVGTDLLHGQTTGKDDLDVFEREIQLLRKAIEEVDVGFLEEDDPHQAKLMALWK